MRIATNTDLTDIQSARLERILEATKRLLGELGAERVTMRDIAQASQVAEGTLYNRFGGKDGLISAAVVDYFERSVQAVVEHHRAETPLQQSLYSIQVVTGAILEAQPFAHALMRTYFRVDDRLLMPDRLTESVQAAWLPIVQEMHRQRLLRSWVSAPLLCGEICERIFGVVLRWAQGRLADRELQERMTFSILIILLGASRGPQAREIEEMLGRAGRLKLESANLGNRHSVQRASEVL